jgi:uncharacterized caspase-like protein
MRRALALALAFLAVGLAFGAPACAAERRIALVIGNSAYTNAPALDNPVHDATAMRDKLQSLGFDVIAGFDLTKAETQAVIAKFAEASRGADVSAFFYAGHGLQVGGENYLVPVDALLKDDISLDFETVPIAFVWRQMSRDTKVRLVFLDACRENPFVRSLAGVGASVSGGLAEMQIEHAGNAGALIAFATAPGQVASDGANGHSPFTAALISHLGDADEPLTSVMTKVTRDVLAATGGRQRPWVNLSLSDDLKLNRSPALETTASAPAAPQASPAEIAELDELRRALPAIDANEVDFDKPLKVGDAALDGKSLAQLTKIGVPLFSPVEGLAKTDWEHPCSACHQWTRDRLCTQSARYLKEEVAMVRILHPLGPRFKAVLANWARSGCK